MCTVQFHFIYIFTVTISKYNSRCWLFLFCRLHLLIRKRTFIVFFRYGNFIANVNEIDICITMLSPCTDIFIEITKTEQVTYSKMRVVIVNLFCGHDHDIALHYLPSDVRHKMIARYPSQNRNWTAAKQT